jgi:hypothetical protein
MTDQEKMTSLLTEFGVPFEVETEGDITVVTVDERSSHPKVGGYGGFYTCFHFDQDGKFIRMGAWE